MVYKSVFVFSWYQNYILFNAFAVKIGNYTLAFIFLSIDNLFVSIKFSPNTDFFISAQLAKMCAEKHPLNNMDHLVLDDGT